MNETVGHPQDYTEKDEMYFDNLRIGILPLLPENIDKVLEIGAGKGATLAFIQAHWESVKTVAVEPFPEAASTARRHVDVVLDKSIEDLTADDFVDAPFDLILCLDVLEHLQDPWTEVEKLTKLLAPGGRIIASIPNVSHYSCLFPLLLKNQWTLKDSGILDRTHLRFFVQKTAIELMTCAGLGVVDVVPNIKWVKNRASFVNKLTLGFFERFLTLQYYVVVGNEK